MSIEMRDRSRRPTPARIRPNVIGTREPCLEAYFPAFGATMMIATVIGRKRTPASNALYPRISCMYNDMKKNVANMPNETLNATVAPAENAGMRKNRSGSIAFGLCRSYRRNDTVRTADATSMLTIRGSLQPFSLASIRA